MSENLNELYEADVLIVDDTVANLQLLTSLLKEEGYKVRPASSGAMALMAIEKKMPDLILLDIKMPEMDGYEVCEKLKSNPITQAIPIIFISALNDVNDKIKAFNVGGVDYINKPFQFEEVKARVSTHLKLRSYQLEMEKKVALGVEKINVLNQEIIDTQRELIFTMGEICETRSHETGQHVKRVSEYSYLLATLCGSEQAELIYQAAPMHDVGKVAISDMILSKNGALTPEEWEVMKTHTSLGFKALASSNRGLLKLAAQIAHEHHEKWDGSGYPQGLKGNEISFAGRITAIADVFDALGSARCYKEAWELSKIIEYMKEKSGSQFEPKLIELFLEHLDEFLILQDKFADEGMKQ
jgi:putative two-component system response regulator